MSGRAAPALVDLWDDRALVLSNLGDVSRHRHAAAALLIGLDGTFAIRVQRRWQRARSAYIPAGVSHELSCGATLMSTLYLFPLSGDSRRLARRFAINPDRVHLNLAVSPHVRDALRQLHGGGGGAQHATRQLLDQLLLAGPAAPVQLDPRVAKVAALLQQEQAQALSLQAIAWEVGLSESRLMHLFKDAVGVPTKRYRLWQRMRRVTEHVAAGDSLTMAALGAGFADSSHLSHGFRNMFGIAASRVLNPRARLRTAATPADSG